MAEKAKSDRKKPGKGRSAAGTAAKAARHEQELRGKEPVTDLRSAIERLKEHPGQYITTDRKIDPIGDLAGVYRRVGAWGTVERPTRIGPAMMFDSIKGFPGWHVLVGLMASRERVGILLDCPADQVTRRMVEGYRNAKGPVDVSADSAQCQQVVHRAGDKGFDLRTLVPAPTNTDADAGPFFCLGLALSSDPELGTDVTIHRLCVQGRDEISIFLAPGRHIEEFRQRAEAKGDGLPISINMGLDPAVFIGAEFEAPTTPLGYDELAVAGGLRGSPVELVPCVTVKQRAIANAEVVIEGYIQPGKRVAEDQHTRTGGAMPEFPGYEGAANPSVPVIKVTAVTTRRDPILQTLVGPGEEHVSLAGIPTEASIYNALDKELPGFVTGVYAHSSGGGKLLAVLRCRKTSKLDDGKVRQAALLAFGTYYELKNVILVDEDVEIFDTNDVLWAMTTRMQGDIDIVTVPGVMGHGLDPSQSPDYNPLIPETGVTTKTIFDATVPYHLRDTFTRAQFRDIDPRPYAPELNLEYHAR